MTVKMRLRKLKLQNFRYAALSAYWYAQDKPTKFSQERAREFHELAVSFRDKYMEVYREVYSADLRKSQQRDKYPLRTFRNETRSLNVRKIGRGPKSE